MSGRRDSNPPRRTALRGAGLRRRFPMRHQSAELPAGRPAGKPATGSGELPVAAAAASLIHKDDPPSYYGTQ